MGHTMWLLKYNTNLNLTILRCIFFCCFLYKISKQHLTTKTSIKCILIQLKNNPNTNKWVTRSIKAELAPKLLWLAVVHVWSSKPFSNFWILSTSKVVMWSVFSCLMLSRRFAPSNPGEDMICCEVLTKTELKRKLH